MINRLYNFASRYVVIVGDWVMATGSWNDAGVWDDTKIWNDDGDI